MVKLPYIMSLALPRCHIVATFVLTKNHALHMRYFTYLAFFLLLMPMMAPAQAAPKRELRAVWIATVGNIDWPSKPGLSASQQQLEFTKKLDFLKSLNFNTVIVQIRPAADAFFESPYEPWSKYLSGKQGDPPYPKYDPLEFMIREAHKRNIDLHAWFNPYRALVNSKYNPNPPTHATRTHPDWLISFGGKTYFDPGNPQAREYIIKVMLDVVRRYDIDAVHIDDYFYPYPERGKSFDDHQSFAKYNNGLALADWRRNNVNTFVSQLNANIKKIKPYVKFGVSPFGIWRNTSQDAEGSATRGTSCYDDLYSDIRLWVRNNWVDYVAPQLYWERDHRVADYNCLLSWWKQNQEQRALYIGLGLYRMVNAKTGVWAHPNELLAQIRETRRLKTDGVVLYSISSFDKISHSIRDSLASKAYFGNISIPPPMHWITGRAPAPPFVTGKPSSGGYLLSWPETDRNERKRYLVYRFGANEEINLNDPSKILALTNEPKYIDATPHASGYYIVTALDRLWNESLPSNKIIR